MSELNVKLSKFKVALKDNNMENVFKEINSNDVTGFIAEQSMHNSICKIIILINQSIFNEGTIIFAKLSDVDKKEKIYILLNELNQKYIPFKFTINENSEIVANVCYIADSEKYNGYEFLETTVSMYKEIRDNIYKDIMKVIWS